MTEHSDASHQFSARRICFAEWTRQGSAYVGELRIFRENSFEDAITIKLYRRKTGCTVAIERYRHRGGKLKG